MDTSQKKINNILLENNNNNNNIIVQSECCVLYFIFKVEKKTPHLPTRTRNLLNPSEHF